MDPQPSTQTEPTPTGYFTSLDKVVPKFCTSVHAAVLQGGNVVLSLIYSEGNQNHTLIERVIIEPDHARRLGEILLEAAKGSNNEQ